MARIISDIRAAVIGIPVACRPVLTCRARFQEDNASRARSCEVASQRSCLEDGVRDEARLWRTARRARAETHRRAHSGTEEQRDTALVKIL